MCDCKGIYRGIEIVHITSLTLISKRGQKVLEIANYLLICHCNCSGSSKYEVSDNADLPEKL